MLVVLPKRISSSSCFSPSRSRRSFCKHASAMVVGLMLTRLLLERQVRELLAGVLRLELGAVTALALVESFALQFLHLPH